MICSLSKKLTTARIKSGAGEERDESQAERRREAPAATRAGRGGKPMPPERPAPAAAAGHFVTSLLKRSIQAARCGLILDQSCVTNLRHLVEALDRQAGDRAARPC